MALRNIDVREAKIGPSVNSQILNRYLDDIRKYPILTEQEEVELFERVKNGDEKAKEQLINCNQRFVYSIAKRYSSSDTVMDLISEGNIGLIAAINKFDPTKGFKFISYAVWHIRQCILNFLRTEHVMIKKSNKTKYSGKISEIRNKHFCENGAWPTDDEIIEALQNEYGITITNKSDVYDLQTVSISGSFYDSDEKTIEESPLFVSKTRSDNDYLDEIDKDYFVKVINGMMSSRLNDREKQILQLSYGINCDKEYTNYEIGKIMGISDERARQIKHIAINKLRRLGVEKYS